MVVELERIVRHNAKLESELIAAKSELAEATARARSLFLPAIGKKVGEILAPLDGKIERVVAAAASDAAHVIEGANQRLDRAVDKAVAAIEANPVLEALNTRMDAIDTRLVRIAEAHESVRPTTVIQVGERWYGFGWAVIRIALLVGFSMMLLLFLSHWFPRTVGVPSAEFMIGGDDTIVRELIEHRSLHVSPAPGSVLLDALPPTPPTTRAPLPPTPAFAHSPRHRR